jgi:citrate synthase
MSTASCTSQITYIDGDQGILRHRGYDVADLANNKSFLDVTHLLFHGDLPDVEKSKNFELAVKSHAIVNENIAHLFDAFAYNAHPMAMMLSSFGALSAIYNDDLKVSDASSREEVAIRVVAKMPTLAAMCYKHSLQMPFVKPDPNLGFIDNFLHMMFSTDSNKYKVNKIVSTTLEKIFIIHADHEQNASTSTVRTAGSSGANPYACVSAGIASLWGAAHGGANEAVINMLRNIGSVDKIPEYIAKAKNPDDDFKLMGFGHRVYKNYDPRATVLKKVCHEVLEALGREDNQLLKIATELEKIALNDEYFIQRKLYPNVDFYSGIIYEAMQIPSRMFTVLFAVARSAGWMAQWMEMVSDSEQKISRPRQLYTGHISRS